MFYSWVGTKGNKVVHIGYDDDGRKFLRKEEFSPKCGIVDEQIENPIYTTIKKEPLSVRTFDGVNDYKDYVKKYGDVVDIHGEIDAKYQFLIDHYVGEIKYDLKKVRVMWLDIEVDADRFPHPSDAFYPITAVTFKIRNTGKFFTLATKPYDKCKTILDIDPNKIAFKQCKDEYQLIETMIYIIQQVAPDIMVGWNSMGFDFPYIINRIKRLYEDNVLKSLSPLGRVWISERKNKLGQIEYNIKIDGISLLDYMLMYKKYIFTPRESYALDFIAEEELGENKIDYSEYDNLSELWEKNPQKYIDYNILDVELMDRLENKLGIMGLHCTITYTAKCNFEDAMSPVRTWDVILYEKQLKENILCPPHKEKEKVNFAGAYVKEPIKGLYSWLFSGDLNSLYPHLIQQFNVSPETIIENMKPIPVRMNEIDDRFFDETWVETVKNDNYVLAANGYFFDKEHEGILSRVMKEFYSNRKTVKNDMLNDEQTLEYIKEEISRRGL